jgi:hypothetical protein
MTSLLLLDLTARLLSRDEREAAVGDLVEAGESGWSSLRSILGLVIRRQALLWRSWPPWLAAFGIALPGSFLLMGHSLAVSWSVQRLAQSPLNQAGASIWPLLGKLFLLVAWSWTAGFVVGSISRPTLWASIAFSCAPCFFCLARFRESSLPGICLLLFLAPAALGLRQGLRLTRIKATPAFVLAAAITLTMILLPGGSLWSLKALLIWPSWHIAASALKKGAI